MAMFTPHDGKRSSIADRVRQPVHYELARGNKPYRNRLRASDGWTHQGTDGETHTGEWQQCETCR